MTPNVHSADTEFDYPEELPDRFAWFIKKAGVGEVHLLYLLGLDPPQQGGADWVKIVEHNEDGAIWLEGVLYDTLAAFNYDAAAMKDRLSQPPEADAIALPPTRRWVVPETNEDRVRFFHGWNFAALAQLGQGGPGALPAFIAFLSQPPRVIQAISRK